jgi:hypothetical protein
VLGELKGGALKAGQLLSTVEALFPQDPESTWRETLVGLQDGNAPAALRRGRAGAARRARRGWRRASRLRRAGDGRRLDRPGAPRPVGRRRAVAVKVQYPGGPRGAGGRRPHAVGDVRAAALVARGLALPPLVAELRDRLTEELDYLHEARTQTRFADGVRRRPRRRRAGRRARGPRVLVMDWLDGTPLATVAAPARQAERDARPRSTSASWSAGPDARRPAAHRPRTRATSGCCPTGGSGCWTSARRWRCPAGCRRRSAG